MIRTYKVLTQDKELGIVRKRGRSPREIEVFHDSDLQSSHPRQRVWLMPETYIQK